MDACVVAAQILELGLGSTRLGGIELGSMGPGEKVVERGEKKSKFGFGVGGYLLCRFSRSLNIE